MKNQSIINRIAVCAIAALVAAGGYMFVPPPQSAHAFEAQSTWGGAGGGTANAQTIAVANVQSLNDVLGVPLRYIPSTDNAGPATISINGLTATAVRRPSNIGLVALSGGELQAGVTMTVMYNGSTIEIQGPVDMTAIGSTVEYRGGPVLRGTLIEDGSCISAATYAPLFSVIGRNYGTCDGTTTFGLPDSRGTMFAALDNQGSNGAANRITSAGSGCNATTTGLCGAQNQNLSIANINSFTPAFTGSVGTVNVTTTINSVLFGVTNYNAGPGGNVIGTTNNIGSVNSSGSFTPAGTIAALGSGTPHSILNPILPGRRAIKY